ncbi:MAG TPA: carboxymuconolactone decarboxylase family protein [Aeromonadales bacterium]|nr:carboxymuconolactone decarboxylase family protein [Aeromonadales bacterium]
MTQDFEQFRQQRIAGNEKVLQTDSLTIKRIFSLDKQAYKENTLSKATKELLGLVASLVLRCNDCVDYHLEQAVAEGFSKEQIDEAMGIAVLVGGTIVIPHLRHAAKSLDFLFSEK